MRKLEEVTSRGRGGTGMTTTTTGGSSPTFQTPPVKMMMKTTNSTTSVHGGGGSVSKLNYLVPFDETEALDISRPGSEDLNLTTMGVHGGGGHWW